jgi:hypothetical protein
MDKKQSICSPRLIFHSRFICNEHGLNMDKKTIICSLRLVFHLCLIRIPSVLVFSYM